MFLSVAKSIFDIDNVGKRWGVRILYLITVVLNAAIHFNPWADTDFTPLQNWVMTVYDMNDYDPSDRSFCCNGVIAADRTLHPHAYEVGYQYRSILTTATAEEALAGKVNVYNEYFFIDLSRYMMQWDVEVDGVEVLAGVVPSLSAAPHETVAVDLGFTAAELLEACAYEDLADHDVYLNVRYVL